MIYFMMCPHDSGILSYCTCALPPDSSTRTCRENKGYYCSVLSRHWWQGHNMFRCHHTKIRRAVNNRCTFRIISLEIEFLAFMTTSHISSQPSAPTHSRSYRSYRSVLDRTECEDEDILYLCCLLHFTISTSPNTQCRVLLSVLDTILHTIHHRNPIVLYSNE